MKRSTERILTTHTGSLPRTPKVIELLLAEQQARGAHKAALDAAVRAAIAHVVAKQIECDLDIINDGEDNLMRVMGFFVMLLPSGACWSVNSLLRHWWRDGWWGGGGYWTGGRGSCRAAEDASRLVPHAQFYSSQALDAVLADIASLGGRGGLIAVAPSGEAAWGFTTPAMYRGMADAHGSTVRIYSEEEDR